MGGRWERGCCSAYSGSWSTGSRQTVQILHCPQGLPTDLAAALVSQAHPTGPPPPRFQYEPLIPPKLAPPITPHLRKGWSPLPPTPFLPTPSASPMQSQLGVVRMGTDCRDSGFKSQLSPLLHNPEQVHFSEPVSSSPKRDGDSRTFFLRLRENSTA